MNRQRSTPEATLDGARLFGQLAAFVLAPEPAIPDSALAFAARLLADTLGVAAGASGLEAGRIARETALALYGPGTPSEAAPLLFDGRVASTAGAAFALASQIDNLDAHDGYNPCKGHIGCALVPALFAIAHGQPGLKGRAALEALVIGYEVAARAGTALHATVADYHTSGAWNALGVAAMACRLRGASAGTLREALGIAEYHGPRSQMMREIAHPTMLHDGSGMGALVGLSAAAMAMRGFEGAPAITVEGAEAAAHWADLGQVWTVEANYIKPYPTCRWSHAAIDAVAGLMHAHGLAADAVTRLEVETFAEAAALFGGMPRTTSEAQYSLAWGVAAMLARGRVGPAEVSPDAFDDPEIRAALARITVRATSVYQATFPAYRRSGVALTLGDGRRMESGPVEARGGPDTPLDDAAIRAKLALMTEGRLDPARAEALWQGCLALPGSSTPFATLAALCCPPATLV